MNPTVQQPKFTLNDSDQRIGTIEKLSAPPPSLPAAVATAIVKDVFTMKENIRLYVGSEVHVKGKKVGELLGPFAKSGKCKIGLTTTLVEGDEVCLMLQEQKLT